MLYPENKKTLSRDQHGQPIVNLLLFADEDEYAFSHLRVSLEADATRRAEVRANALLNWSLNLLGNTLSSNARNMPSNQTYIIDGKMINCVTMGTITNCN